MPFTSGIGVTELIIVLVIVLLIFGPKRLPGMGKALGSGMREFKDSITGKSTDDDDDDEDRPSITAADGEASSSTRSTERERASVDAS
jgi:sec-independent protein translocase protein TatA